MKLISFVHLFPVSASLASVNFVKLLLLDGKTVEEYARSKTKTVRTVAEEEGGKQTGCLSFLSVFRKEGRGMCSIEDTQAQWYIQRILSSCRKVDAMHDAVSDCIRHIIYESLPGYPQGLERQFSTLGGCACSCASQPPACLTSVR